MSHESEYGSNRRRRSSVYNSFQELLNTGGKNSISNFASSYSRSTNFIASDFEVTPRPSSLTYGSYEDSPLINESQPHSYGVAHNDYAAVSEDDTDEVRSSRSVIFKQSGNSTSAQTIFNGINTLIGIGILSLPLGLHYSGWILGSLILLGCALTTQYTAKLLARCLQKKEELKTYGDIAEYSFGRIAYLIVVSTFSIDLLSAGISMIIIFADSFNALTGIDAYIFKSIISIIFFILSFVRLDVLSHLSLVGIISTSLIVIIVFSCGFIKKDSPGSLLHVAETSLWPESLLSLFLSIGIFMSPFGGHAIFPELYGDMKHPDKYNKSCTTIFSFTWSVDFILASLGYLMFGKNISDQVTKSIVLTQGFPNWIKVSIGILMGILPISKGPLITRPIITLIDQLTVEKLPSTKHYHKVFALKFLNRLVVILVFFLTSLIFTDFGKIMSFLGSAICFAICVIYPISFYLKLYIKELSRTKVVLYTLGLIVSTILAVLGTLAVAIAS